MKSKTIFLLGLLLLGVFSNLKAQNYPSLFIKGTNTNYVTTCSDGHLPILRLNLGPGVTLSNVAGQIYSMEFWEVEPNKADNKIFDITLNDYSSFTQNGQFDIVSAQTRFAIDDSLFTKRQNFGRRNITFYIIVRKYISMTSSFIVGGTNSNSFTIIAGIGPAVNIGIANKRFIPALPKFKAGERNVYTVYRGCEDSIPPQTFRLASNIRVRLDSTQTCSNNSFTIVAWEIDKITGLDIGPHYFLALNSGNVTALKSGNGFPIGEFNTNTNSPNSSNNGTFQMELGKTYVVGIEYTGQRIKKGTLITINYSPIGWDLAMRDNKVSGADNFEPGDKWEPDLFRSPDLWNKLSTTSNPNTDINENPDYITNPANTNKIIIRAQNMGCKPSPDSIPVRLYWTRARTNEIYKNHWVYDTVNNIVFSKAKNKNVPAGSEITIAGSTIANPYSTNSRPFKLPAIAAKGTYTMPFNKGVKWFPPDPLDFDSLNGNMSGGGTTPVICLLARINEKTSGYDPIYYEPSGTVDTIDQYVRRNNNVVTRNCYLLNDANFYVWSGGGGNGWNNGYRTVHVNNPSSGTTTTKICLNLLPDSGLIGNFLNNGFIEISTTGGLYSNWQTGGSSVTGISNISSSYFKVTNGTRACLNNITLAPGASEHIGVRFNFDNAILPTVAREYYYQFSQENSDSIDSTYFIEHIDSLGTPASIDTIAHKVLFTKHRSDVVFDVKVPTSPPIGAAPTLRMIDIANVKKIMQVYPNPTNDVLNVKILSESNLPAKLILSDSRGIIIRQYQYQTKGQLNEVINTTGLPSGLYILTYKQGDVIQTLKFTIIH